MRAQASENETERNEMESGELMRQLAEQAQSAGEKAQERERDWKRGRGKEKGGGRSRARERALLLRGWVADIRVPSPTGKCS